MINLSGDEIFLHVTVKGKTERCLPPETFQNQIKARKILFGFSENYWVSKDTMRQQVMCADNSRLRVVEVQRLPSDQKMIILWDVYCRHRDSDLLDFIRDRYPNIIVQFVPVSLTEIYQPLDILFNAEFKITLATLKNKRAAQKFDGWLLERDNSVKKQQVRARNESKNH